MDSKKFKDRRTEYVRYSGTKHDGSRRFFGTPNIVSYFHISSFIWKNWKKFEKNYGLSKYSIGIPKRMEEGAERAVKVPSLSELSKHASKNLGYAPFILKADIAQCFPSIYTHSIPWAAHGIKESKSDTNKQSNANIFNALDFFVRVAQQGNTRGVLVGPDAYRLVAEFILSKIDHELDRVVGNTIVGAVRHVDDYYIGLRTEHDAQSVLSHLREVLATYELNLNDHKTKIYSSLEPINDLWAQRLRDHMPDWEAFSVSYEEIERAISEAVVAAKESGSDSPIKILFRSFDEGKIYFSPHWEFVEHNIQRIIQKHPHAIDYACLLVAKRSALDLEIDSIGWLAVADIIVGRSLALNHHHEVLWMVWLLIVCGVELPVAMAEELAKSRNSHIRALLVQAHVDGILKRKPKLALGSGLSTVDENWLVNLVARSQGFSGANFSGAFSSEFDYLANKKIKLVDFEQHINTIKVQSKRAISRTRYGYDDESDEDDFPDAEDFDFDDWMEMQQQNDDEF
ncbi:RNA-directed DNA polymerase [Phaeobacter inhibens]|uniref:RNA-directed DNA polymerase n=1 Tax=Phaeobacter inhibens TaxID=221822 RepID=UPI0024B6DA90|nr:RNA-directed DNA polymerase [Phaeobacter inhibens]WHP69592.1 RNA-directed DNA polymerase [Phaeobacter inhibens]